MAAISRGKERFESNSRTRCLLNLAMSLPSYIGINKKDLEKSAKMWLQTLKMAAIFRGQLRLRGTFTNKVALTPGNVLTKFCKKENIFGEECKNVISDPKNGCQFPRSRTFEPKFTDKLPLTPSNVPNKFCWNKQNRFGEEYKMWFQSIKMAVISWDQGRLIWNSPTRCLSHLTMSMPGVVGITKKIWRKLQNVISEPKNSPHFMKSKLFEVKFTDKVILTPNNVPTKFCWNNQRRFEEEWKNVISDN